jgi:hypothetical protein
MGNYHVRFCNGGGAGDRSTDRSEADTPIEAPIVAGFRLRSLWRLLGASFHPRAAYAQSVSAPSELGVSCRV